MSENQASDPTFRSYNTAQAKLYAEQRTSYPPQIYNSVLAYHADTGGQFETLLDVGCGPGNATRDLSASFNHAVGIDPGVEMIQTARELGGTTNLGQPVLFQVCTAEDCASVKDVENGVDLLVAAMAAHWFSMPEFWAAAANIVKPGGTVALWTNASLYCHPETPNAAAVQKALFYLERDALQPFELPPNRLSRDLYDNLALPWTVDPPVPAFPEADFVRVEWDRDGIPTDGKNFLGERNATTIQELEQGLSTASMVTRWREAHPELAHTDKDCVKVAMDEVRKAMEGSGQEELIVGSATVVLLFKRR